MPTPDTTVTNQDRSAILAMLEEHGAQLGRVAKAIEKMDGRLQQHLISCTGRHGGLDGRLVRLEERMGDYSKAFSKHGQAHQELDRRVRTLEDTDLVLSGQDVPGLNKRVKAIEDELKEDKGVKKTWAKVWPLLVAGGGGAAGLQGLVKLGGVFFGS